MYKYRGSVFTRTPTCCGVLCWLVAIGLAVRKKTTVFPRIVRALRIDRVGCLERAKYSAPSNRARSIIKAKCCLVGHILRNHQALLRHEDFQKLALLP